ncbi:MAG: FAD-dependent oxidoreductase [Acidiferrobacterales bacterium]|nr:FAD-dependent oxidoreductase [Acidiferrobacterales bacterium]
MSKFDANLVVIGAGSAGLVSAYIGSAIKAKVILIEKGKMGGDCLNTGCVPSKSLIASAKLLHQIKHSQNWGIKSASAEFDFADIMNRVKTIIATIEPHDSVERYQSLGVEVIQGEATLKSPTEVEVNGRTISTRNIIIASGAKPFVPPIEGLDQIPYLTSDNIWDMQELPKKMVVLGGGPIGCELAQCFGRFGCDVSIVEMLPQIMIREDEEIAEFMANRFHEEGVRILTNHKAIRVTEENGLKVLYCDNDGNEVRVEFDEILVAVGRAARSSGYGMEEVKIPISKRRTVETNEYLQAGYPSIFACGDIVGPYQFTHVAAHQAWYAAVNALFRPFKKFKVDYRVIPWATYTDPEVARVGLNEQEAKEQNIAYEVTRYDLSGLDRALADGHAEGVVKVLTVPGKDKILGVTIMGSHAGDLIAEFVMAMKHGLGMNKILGTIHSYPTWMEANKFAAGNWKKAHAPEWALTLLEKFHAWRRG